MEKELISKAEIAIKRGLEWLIAENSSIDTITDFAAHYKAPYLYSVTGLRERSRKYADLLERSYLREDGDFRMSADEKGWQHMPASPGNRYIYGNGWAIAGLQKIGAYGVARKGLKFLERFQDPDTGGFFSRYNIKEKKIDRTRLDTSSTCSGVLAFLACGRFEDAIRGGDFLLRMMDEQPQGNRYFFTTLEKGGGILPDVFHEENAAAFNGRKHFCVSTEHNALYEMVWFIGMPMKILGVLYDLTSERKYMEGAIAYFRFFNMLSEGRWLNNSGTKVMWGAAELYRLTGDPELKNAAVKYLDWLVRSQNESGVWVHSLWYKSIEEQPFQATLDLVQEYVSEFSDVLYSLYR